MTLSASRMVVFASMLFLVAACGGSRTAPQPSAAMTPITLPPDLSTLDLCQAVPPAAIETVLGHTLSGAPQRFAYGGASGSTGCQYDAGKDARGNARFAYVALTPAAAFDQQPLSKNVGVAGIGDAAYFNNGPDARQLWVRLGDKAALVVAIGDEVDEQGLKTIAMLVASALR